MQSFTGIATVTKGGVELNEGLCSGVGSKCGITVTFDVQDWRRRKQNYINKENKTGMRNFSFSVSDVKSV